MNSKKLQESALQFLRWFCPPNLYEGIEGDLLEQYQNDVLSAGPGLSDDQKERRARRRFVLGVLRFFRPGIILRNKFSSQLMQTTMLKNYFKVSYRHLLKNKSFA